MRPLRLLLSALIVLLSPGPSAWSAVVRIQVKVSPMVGVPVPGFGHSSPIGNPLTTPLTSQLGAVLPGGKTPRVSPSIRFTSPSPALAAPGYEKPPLPPIGQKAALRAASVAARSASVLKTIAREATSPDRAHASGGSLSEILQGRSPANREGTLPVQTDGRWNSAAGILRHDGHDHGEDLNTDYDPSVPAPEVTPRQKKRFSFYKLGVSAVKIGMETMNLAVPLMILTQFGSVTAVGTIVIGANLAGLAAGWVGAPLIDRFRPSRVLAATAVLQALAIGALPFLYLTGSVLTLPLVGGLYITAGGFHGLFEIARRAELPHILGRHEGTLREYNGRLYLWRETAALGGDAGAGLITKNVGVLTALWMHPLSYLFAAYQFIRLAATSDPVRSGQKEERPGLGAQFQELLAGARIVLSDPALRMAAFVNVPVLVLHQLFHTMIAAVYATKVLGNPMYAAILVGAWNVGELASAWFLKRYGKKGNSFQWLRVGAAAGLGSWLLWLWPSIWMATPVIFLLGAATLSNELGLASFFQSRSSKESVGAATGFIYSLSTGAAMLALFAMGRLFDAFDPMHGFFVFAVMLSAVSLLYLRSSYLLRKGAPDLHGVAGAFAQMLSRRDRTIAQEDAEAGEVPSVTLKPSKKKKKTVQASRSKGWWKKWIIAGILTIAAISGSYLTVSPRLDPVRPPATVVIVDKAPFELQQDAASSILRPEIGSDARYLFQMIGHPDVVRSVSVSENGKALLSVDETGAWKVWDLETGKAFSPRNYPGKVRSALFADNGRKIILIDEDATVRLADLHGGGVRTLKQDVGDLKFTAISPDAQRVTVVTRSKDVHILRLATGETQSFKVEGSIMALGSTARGEMLMTSKRGMTKLWLVEPGKAPVVILEKYLPGLKMIDSAISRDGKVMIAVADMAGDQIVLAWVSGTDKIHMLSAEDFGPDELDLASAASSADGRTTVVLAKSGGVWKWSPGSPPVKLGEVPSGSHISLSANGKIAYAADAAGNITAWLLDRE